MGFAPPPSRLKSDMPITMDYDEDDFTAYTKRVALESRPAGYVFDVNGWKMVEPLTPSQQMVRSMGKMVMSAGFWVKKVWKTPGVKQNLITQFVLIVLGFPVYVSAPGGFLAGYFYQKYHFRQESQRLQNLRLAEEANRREEAKRQEWLMTPEGQWATEQVEAYLEHRDPRPLEFFEAEAKRKEDEAKEFRRLAEEAKAKKEEAYRKLPSPYAKMQKEVYGLVSPGYKQPDSYYQKANKDVMKAIREIPRQPLTVREQFEQDVKDMNLTGYMASKPFEGNAFTENYKANVAKAQKTEFPPKERIKEGRRLPKNLK